MDEVDKVLLDTFKLYKQWKSKRYSMFTDKDGDRVLLSVVMIDKKRNQNMSEETKTEKNAKPLHKFMASEKIDREGKTYYFSGGAREDKTINLKDVVIFVFPQENDNGTQTMKVTICEGKRNKV